MYGKISTNKRKWINFVEMHVYSLLCKKLLLLPTIIVTLQYNNNYKHKQHIPNNLFILIYKLKNILKRLYLLFIK